MQRKVLCGIRPSFPGLSQSAGQITHVLLTRSPLNHNPKEAIPFDLHVLSTPPAFVLSQDQTLQKNLTPSQRKPNEGFHIKALLAFKQHTVEFSNNTRTPITRPNLQTRSEGQVSRRFFFALQSSRTRTASAPVPSSGNLCTLSGPLRDVKSLGPKGGWPLISVSEAHLRAVRARVATPGGSDAVLGWGES